MLTLHGSFDLHPTHALAAFVVVKADPILHFLNLKSWSLLDPGLTSLLAWYVACHRPWCRPLS